MLATKPTHFAAWRLPVFDHWKAFKRAPTPWHMRISLAGRNADGSFKTAIAKEYPHCLCDAIGGAFYDHAMLCNERGSVHFDQAPDSLSYTYDDILKPFQVEITDQELFGDDFVDTGFLPLLSYG